MEDNIDKPNEDENNTSNAGHQFSDIPNIHRLIEQIVTELKTFTEQQAKNISDLVEIGKAMSSERDLSKVLELILRQAMQFTNADGGTLYLLSEGQNELLFYVVINETLKAYNMGGTSNQEVSLPNIPLSRDGSPNYTHVCSYVALTNKIVNIPDVYKADGFNFEGAKEFDKMMQYRSESMLVVPMCDHEEQMIGVLQLINSKNTSGDTIPFSSDVTDLTEALASQAAVMLTQQNLIRNLKDLFESFIKAIATAIEEKSKYTGGHIERVAELTMQLADKINQSEEGIFGSTNLSHEEMEELRFAAWMHDTGKITTSEYVVDKAKKLESLFDRIELVKTRWQVVALTKKLEAEQKKTNLLKQAADIDQTKSIDKEFNAFLADLEDELNFIEDVNRGGEFLSDDKIDRLNSIARKTYSIDGVQFNYLTNNELENLSIRKGTLTAKERAAMENHADLTLKILSNLPWPGKYANVPKIAAAHHEKLDGTGYPMGYKGEEINLQARVMAVADIFEALSAPDRPYKKPMSLPQAAEVLQFMVKDNHLDENVVELLINSGLIDEYAEKFLQSGQHAV